MDKFRKLYEQMNESQLDDFSTWLTNLDSGEQAEMDEFALMIETFPEYIRELTLKDILSTIRGTRNNNSNNG